MRRLALLAATALATLAVVPATAGAAAVMFGLADGTGNLLTFDTANPSVVQADVPIAGIGPQEFAVGIDSRPGTGQLFLVTHHPANQGRLYLLDPATGQATLVTQAPFPLNGGSFGVDFNPVPDRLRVVSNLGQNLQIDPASGGLLSQDTPLSQTDVTGAAHTPGATSTLFGIDIQNDRLVQIGGPNGTPPPDSGAVGAVGLLGVDTDPRVGFDVGPDGTAFASLTTGLGASQLYTINLQNGQATLVGGIGNQIGVRGIALALPAPPTVCCAPPLVLDEILVGPESGRQPVRLLEPDGDPLGSFRPFGRRFGGGVELAAGDLSGDNRDEIVVAPGDGGRNRVLVFDGTGSPVRLDSFLAYGRGFSGGVYVAAGDVNGDGRDDIITGPGPGEPPQVKVFSGTDQSLLASFFPFQRSFDGGVTVAAGDVNGDGRDDIITAPASGGRGQVRIFSGTPNPTAIDSFFPFRRGFDGGIYVGAGDLNGDGRAEIVTGQGGGPRVRVFEGDGDPFDSLNPYGRGFDGGVRVAVGDVDGDGRGEIVTGPARGGRSRIRVFVGADGTLRSSYAGYKRRFTGGATVALGNVR